MIQDKAIIQNANKNSFIYSIYRMAPFHCNDLEDLNLGHDIIQPFNVQSLKKRYKIQWYSYNGRLIVDLSTAATFNDLECLLTQISRAGHYSTLSSVTLKTGVRLCHSYNEVYNAIYRMVLSPMTLWPLKVRTLIKRHVTRKRHKI